MGFTPRLACSLPYGATTAGTHASCHACALEYGLHALQRRSLALMILRMLRR